MNWDGFTFHSPHWLWALLVLPAIWWLRSLRGTPVLVVPFAGAWHRPSLAPFSRWPGGLAALGLAGLVLALARPQEVQQRTEERKEGYDIMLSIDLSGSMLAEDYERDGGRINRLQAIQPVIDAFVRRRPNDRIGLVVFAGRAYTLAPLTFDHDWLRKQIERLSVGLIEDGTAIGDGLGVALTRLEQAKREKGGRRLGAFIVLLTDGKNNKGALTPVQAAEIAKARDIPVYAIGAGRPGIVPYPRILPNGRKIYERIQSDLDEPTLLKLGQMTGGDFYRAMDAGTIESAFRSIDRAKKIEFEARSYLLTRELFLWCAIPGALFLLLAALGARLPVAFSAATVRP